jgi:hypothetical protein
LLITLEIVVVETPSSAAILRMVWLMGLLAVVGWRSSCKRLLFFLYR